MNMKKTGCCQSRHYHEAHGCTQVICLNKYCENYLGYTRPRSTRGSYVQILSIVSILFLTAFLFNDYGYQHMNADTEKASVIFDNIHMHTPLTLENLAWEIRRNDIQYPDVVMAQMRLESGNLESYLLKKTGNMLGMRFAFQRQTTATGIYLPARDTIIYGTQDDLRKYGRMNNYAVYETWQDAVTD